MKVKTCTRCQGRGVVKGQHVMHCGVPGGCYKCDMAGKTQHWTMAERVERFLKQVPKTLATLQEEAEELKAGDALRLAKRNARRAHRGQEALASLPRENHQLVMLRETYRSVLKQQAEVKATQKVTTQQSAASAPYRGA